MSSIEIMNFAALLCDDCHANSVQLGNFLLKYFTPLSSDTETHLCETQDPDQGELEGGRN